MPGGQDSGVPFRLLDGGVPGSWVGGGKPGSWLDPSSLPGVYDAGVIERARGIVGGDAGSTRDAGAAPVVVVRSLDAGTDAGTPAPRDAGADAGTDAGARDGGVVDRITSFYGGVDAGTDAKKRGPDWGGIAESMLKPQQDAPSAPTGADDWRHPVDRAWADEQTRRAKEADKERWFAEEQAAFEQREKDRQDLALLRARIEVEQAQAIAKERAEAERQQRRSGRPARDAGVPIEIDLSALGDDRGDAAAPRDAGTDAGVRDAGPPVVVVATTDGGGRDAGPGDAGTIARALDIVRGDAGVDAGVARAVDAGSDAGAVSSRYAALEDAGYTHPVQRGPAAPIQTLQERAEVAQNVRGAPIPTPKERAEVAQHVGRSPFDDRRDAGAGSAISALTNGPLLSGGVEAKKVPPSDDPELGGGLADLPDDLQRQRARARAAFDDPELGGGLQDLPPPKLTRAERRQQKREEERQRRALAKEAREAKKAEREAAKKADKAPGTDVTSIATIANEGKLPQTPEEWDRYNDEQRRLDQAYEQKRAAEEAARMAPRGAPDAGAPASAVADAGAPADAGRPAGRPARPPARRAAPLAAAVDAGTDAGTPPPRDAGAPVPVDAGARAPTDAGASADAGAPTDAAVPTAAEESIRDKALRSGEALRRARGEVPPPQRSPGPPSRDAGVEIGDAQIKLPVPQKGTPAAPPSQTQPPYDRKKPKSARDQKEQDRADRIRDEGEARSAGKAAEAEVQAAEAQRKREQIERALGLMGEERARRQGIQYRMAYLRDDIAAKEGAPPRDVFGMVMKVLLSAIAGSKNVSSGIRAGAGALSGLMRTQTSKWQNELDSQRHELANLQHQQQLDSKNANADLEREALIGSLASGETLATLRYIQANTESEAVRLGAQAFADQIESGAKAHEDEIRYRDEMRQYENWFEKQPLSVLEALDASPQGLDKYGQSVLERKRKELREGKLGDIQIKKGEPELDKLYADAQRARYETELKRLELKYPKLSESELKNKAYIMSAKDSYYRLGKAMTARDKNGNPAPRYPSIMALTFGDTVSHLSERDAQDRADVLNLLNSITRQQTGAGMSPAEAERMVMIYGLHSPHEDVRNNGIRQLMQALQSSDTDGRYLGDIDWNKEAPDFTRKEEVGVPTINATPAPPNKRDQQHNDQIGQEYKARLMFVRERLKGTWGDTTKMYRVDNTPVNVKSDRVETMMLQGYTLLPLPPELRVDLKPPAGATGAKGN